MLSCLFLGFDHEWDEMVGVSVVPEVDYECSGFISSAEEVAVDLVIWAAFVVVAVFICVDGCAFVFDWQRHLAFKCRLCQVDRIQVFQGHFRSGEGRPLLYQRRTDDLGLRIR